MTQRTALETASEMAVNTSLVPLAGSAQGDAEHHGPGEDAHVVGVHEGVDGVGHDVHEQRGEHLPNALGGRLLNHGRGVQREGCREDLAADEGHDSRHQRADDVEHDDGFHGAGALGVAKGTDDQEEHEHGSDGLQSADEQRAQKRNDVGPRLHIRNEQRQDDTDGKANENALDKADLVVLPEYCGDCQGDSPFSRARPYFGAHPSRTVPAGLEREWCGRKDLNLHGGCPPEPKSGASANSATPALLQSPTKQLVGLVNNSKETQNARSQFG